MTRIATSIQINPHSRIRRINFSRSWLSTGDAQALAKALRSLHSAGPASPSSEAPGLLYHAGFEPGLQSMEIAGCKAKKKNSPAPPSLRFLSCFLGFSALDG